jgi:hypothetical protein
MPGPGHLKSFNSLAKIQVRGFFVEPACTHVHVFRIGESEGSVRTYLDAGDASCCGPQFPERLIGGDLGFPGAPWVFTNNASADTGPSYISMVPEHSNSPFNLKSANVPTMPPLYRAVFLRKLPVFVTVPPDSLIFSRTICCHRLPDGRSSLPGSTSSSLAKRSAAKRAARCEGDSGVIAVNGREVTGWSLLLDGSILPDFGAIDPGSAPVSPPTILVMNTSISPISA